MLNFTKIFVFWKMRCLSVNIRSMHVELYKIFCVLELDARCFVSIRSMHVELYKMRFSVSWKCMLNVVCL